MNSEIDKLSISFWSLFEFFCKENKRKISNSKTKQEKIIFKQFEKDIEENYSSIILIMLVLEIGFTSKVYCSYRKFKLNTPNYKFYLNFMGNLKKKSTDVTIIHAE